MSNLDLYYLIENFRRITETTSIRVYEYFGKNNKYKADEIAVNAMRDELGKLAFKSQIIIGEGEKDKAPMLYEGEILGKGETTFDLAVDPLECTTNFSMGLPNSMCIIAFTENGGMVKVPGTYMEQWIAGPSMKSPFEPKESLKLNLQKLSDSLKKNIKDLIIVVQNRPRHEKLIQELRDFNCSITLIDSGSITAALDICMEFGHYDALIGTYGAPEGLISALIAKVTGSEMKAILRPHEEKYQIKWKEEGFTDDQILDKNDLVKGNILGVSATCISTNLFMKGIQKKGNKFSGQTMTLSPKGFDIHDFTTWE